MFDHYYNCNDTSIDTVIIDREFDKLSKFADYGFNKCLQFFSDQETYSKKVSYEKRCEEFKKIKIQHPDHIPVIIDSLDPDIKISKIKYLIHKDSSASDLIFAIRKQVKLDKGSSLFIFCNNTLLCNTETIKTIYEKNKENNPGEDNFIYLSINKENTFG